MVFGQRRVDSDIRGIVRADTRDDEAANNLRDVVRGFLALAKLQAGSRPEFQMMMQSLELGGTGKSVALSFSIPGAGVRRARRQCARSAEAAGQLSPAATIRALACRPVWP